MGPRPARQPLTTDGGGAGQYDGSVPSGTPVRTQPPASPAASSEGPGAPAPLPVPPDGATWVEITSAPLPVGAVAAWAGTPEAGAVVTFSGTVRDRSEGREGVTSLSYEAYVEGARARLAEVAADVRRRWPDACRVAALHRTGRLAVGDVAVVVAVSAPHRESAFAAATHGIDVLKATVPLWKREAWADGDDWSAAATSLADPTLPPESVTRS